MTRPKSTCACSAGSVSNRTVAFGCRGCRSGCMNSLRMEWPPWYPWARISRSSTSALSTPAASRWRIYGLYGSSFDALAGRGLALGTSGERTYFLTVFRLNPSERPIPRNDTPCPCRSYSCFTTPPPIMLVDYLRHHGGEALRRGWVKSIPALVGHFYAGDHTVGGCSRGRQQDAEATLWLLVFPLPPSEPDVRVSTHPALHRHAGGHRAINACRRSRPRTCSRSVMMPSSHGGRILQPRYR